MQLTAIERMLLDELVRQKREAMAAAEARIGEAVSLIAERVGIPPGACVISAQTGEITDARNDNGDDVST